MNDKCVYKLNQCELMFDDCTQILRKFSFSNDIEIKASHAVSKSQIYHSKSLSCRVLNTLLINVRLEPRLYFILKIKTDDLHGSMWRCNKLIVYRCCNVRVGSTSPPPQKKNLTPDTPFSSRPIFSPDFGMDRSSNLVSYM